MPQYGVKPYGVEGKDEVERFFNFPLWGGIGPKFYKVASDVFGAEVTKPAPGEKKVVEKVIEKVTKAPKIGFEVLQKVLLGNKQLNPSAAELPHALPPAAAPAPPAAQQPAPANAGKPAEVQMPPMWLADP